MNKQTEQKDLIFEQEEWAKEAEQMLPESMRYESSEGIKNRLNQKINNGTSRNRSRKKKYSVQKKILIPAAIITLFTGISVAGAKGLWHLGNPGTYSGDTVKINETVSYVWDDENEKYENANLPEGAGMEAGGIEENEPEENGAQENSFSDAYFLEKAGEIISIVNEKAKLSLDLSKLQITYQTDENWNREEAMVSCPLAGKDRITTVTFDRESGTFLSMDFWGGENQSSNQPMSEQEVLAAAEAWYQKLPFPENYTFIKKSEFDEHAWMYDFGKSYTLEIDGKTINLQNELETARITVDPTNGQMILCNSFYAPLLDDHEEGMKPLTEEEAIRMAKERYEDYEQSRNRSVKWEKVKISARTGIVLPDYENVQFYTTENQPQNNGTETGKNGTVTEQITIPEQEEAVSYRKERITRFAWVVQFIEENSELGASDMRWSIDLYSGEVLSVDSTK
ncbi:MAG: hypothetical protein MR487_08570 [Lachnospiraceae bacterium]|nr:hypothetical protein [Lachnospiraceae bacterium]